ncbi:MAG: hypothetical protein ABWK04_01290 [Hydrogenobacter sp.]|uniref:hypothetical protein n=1 Tax=Hydrogenobacter thermophilus TaxID=940 RepID=UPI0030F5A8A0
MDQFSIGHVLMIVSRLFEMLSFGIILLFVFKGIAVRYIFFVAGVTLLGIFISVINFFSKKYPIEYSFIFEALVFLVVLGTAFYAFMEKREKKFLPPPPPPKGTRCPVCSAFIKREDDYCVAREGEELLYFDSCEHLWRFLEDFSIYKDLRRIRLNKVESIYKKGNKTWEDLKFPI